MTTTETLPVRYASEDNGNVIYDVTETPLKVGGRRDVQVHTPRKRDAVAQTSIVDHLRRFFAAIDQEAKHFEHDPFSNVQALAKVEAMLADLRYVRDTLHKYVADALAEQRIRRLTVDGVITVEGTTDVKRTEWQNDQLLREVAQYVLGNLGGVRGLDGEGQIIESDELGNWIGDAMGVYFKPDWRLTPLRAAGFDPDDYCTLPTDDETGKVVRTPTLKIVDNQERRTTT